MTSNRSLQTGAFLLAASAAMCASFARADVSIDEKTSLDLTLFKGTAKSTESFSADKKRHDSSFECGGIISFLCGKTSTAEIVRLDKGVTWELEPDKKRYREDPFLTPAQRKEMQERMTAAIEKAKQCSAQQPPAQQPAIDTSKCQMSAPKYTAKDLGDDGQVLGHGVHRARATITQTCTNKDTGDVCDMQYGFEAWLTNDKIDGLADRDAFTKAYLNKIGLTGDSSAALQARVAQALAPYAKELGQLQTKMKDFKGTPLRSSIHVAFGGPQCGAAKTKEGSSQSSDTVSSSGDVTSRALQATVGKLAGMFGKKKKKEEADAAPANTTAPSPALDSDSPDMAKLVTILNETTAIRTGPVAADRFEIPADYTKVIPEPVKEQKEVTCDKPDK